MTTRKQRNDYVDRRSNERALREAGLPTTAPPEALIVSDLDKIQL